MNEDFIDISEIMQYDDFDLTDNAREILQNEKDSLSELLKSEGWRFFKCRIEDENERLKHELLICPMNQIQELRGKIKQMDFVLKLPLQLINENKLKLKEEFENEGFDRDV